MLLRRQYFAFNFGLFSLIVFMVLTLLAMVIYPGGTNVDPSTEGYLFTKNFFSDLGRYQTFDGQPKLTSMILFMVALVAAAVGSFIYFLSAPFLFRGGNRLLAKIGSVPGIVSAICFAGVAFTPWDIYGVYHGYFVKAAFFSFLLTVFFYATATFRTKTIHNRYGWVFLSFSIILMGYLYLLFWGPSAKTTEGLLIQAIGQKIVVYAQIFCMLVQVSWARKTVKGQL